MARSHWAISRGVIAKRVDRPYKSGDRTGMIKVKKLRTMECVVGGFTYASDNQSVASLLLGLFDEGKNLRYVGSTTLTNDVGSRVLYQLVSIIQEPGFVRLKGGGRFLSSFPDEWTPVKPMIVAEVRYDRFTGGHFRHGTQFLRWRPAKSPADCVLSKSK
jgi:ATP-dependent DNA ligase